MKLRCHNPCCREVVKTEEGFKRYDDRIFCSVDCINQYILQVKRFALTTTIIRQEPPLNYKPRKLD